MTSSVEMVRQAEQKSEETVSSADYEAGQIIGAANKAAASIIAGGIEASKGRFADSVAGAHRENHTLMEEFSVEIDAEVQSLIESTRPRIAGAVESVFLSIA